ncbi:DNA-binding protein [bacterium]|nr:DNA-binding protein [bacterium]|tara:strand:- start:8232 stop:8408 length:177 start_codon:yes stop_codon:yes gene_type:complete
MEKEFYTPAEVAEKLRVNIMTIYRYIKAGKINAHKLGKDFRIDVKEYERFLKSIETNN